MENSLQLRLQAIMGNAMRDIATALKGATTGEIANLFPDVPGATRESASAPMGNRYAAKQAPKKGRQPSAPQLTRQQVNDLVFGVIAKASEPIGVRDIAKELKLNVDRVAPSLVSLREKGSVVKHGDKAKTLYTISEKAMAPVVHVTTEDTEASVERPEVPVQTESAQSETEAPPPPPVQLPTGVTANRYKKQKASA